MALPSALLPLRHPLFRMLWSANVVVSLGVWMQNTGAGWLMTTLDPDPLVVSMVQAATILPIFLLALPAGAIADIFDALISTLEDTRLEPDLDDLLYLGDRDPAGHCGQGVEVPRRTVVDEVAEPVAPPGVNQREINHGAAFHEV